MASAKVQGWIADVKAVTAGVETNGQAVALALKSMRDGVTVAGRFSTLFGSSFQGQILAWVTNVQEHLRDVQSDDPTAKVGRSWVTLRNAIHGLYIGIWSVVDSFPEGSSAWSDAAGVAGELAATLPAFLESIARKAANTVPDLALPILKGLWPVLVPLALVAAVAFVVLRSGKVVPS